MASILEKKAKTSTKAVKQAVTSHFESYRELHQQIYGKLPGDTQTEFDFVFNKIRSQFKLEDDVCYEALSAFLLHNRETNKAPFNGMCSTKALGSDFSLVTVWPTICAEISPVETISNEKNAYFGITEYSTYVTLFDGLSTIKVEKSKCTQMDYNDQLIYIPKDMRLKSHYDYNGLILALNEDIAVLDFEPPVFGKMKCYGYFVCGTYPDGCKITCPKLKKLNYLFNSSNIPKRYLAPSVFTEPNFKGPILNQMSHMMLSEIRDSISEFVSSGDSLVLYSTMTGTGKTTWATTLAKYYIFRRLRQNMLVPEVYYLNTADFFSLIKSAIGSNDSGLKQEINEITNLAKEVPLLIVDDLGSEKASDWSREQLYTIINARYSDELSTIYTTNLDLGSQLAVEHLGARTVSRIREATLVNFDQEEVH